MHSSIAYTFTQNSIKSFCYVLYSHVALKMATQAAFARTSHRRRRNRGGGAPGARPPPPPLVGICLLVTPLQTVWYGDLFAHTPVAGTHAVMAQRSLNMASGTSKTLRPGILAASSPNINLSTNMASEVISEHLIFKFFSGGAGPKTPLVCACLHTHHHRCLPNHKYLPPPMLLDPQLSIPGAIPGYKQT